MTFKLTPDHVDTWLKTSDGRKVKCVDREGNKYLIIDHDWMTYTVNQDGHYEYKEYIYSRTFNDVGYTVTKDNSKDIIGEWKEPETKEVVLYLVAHRDYIGAYGTLLPTINEKIIGSTKVTLTEGVFHDDNR